MIAVLSELGLYQTVAKLHSKCVQNFPKDIAQVSGSRFDDLRKILIQGYQCQLKWIATLRSNYTRSSQRETYCHQRYNDELFIARSVIRSWEEAQIMAMTLVKYDATSSTLSQYSIFKCWTAFATIQC